MRFNLATLLWGFAVPLHSVQAETTPLPEPAESPGHVRTYMLAQDLHRLGMVRKDALTVLTAARLAASIQFQDASDIRPEVEAGTSAGKSPAATVDGPGSALDMLAHAKALAGEDDLALSLIAAAEGDHAATAGQVIRRQSTIDADSIETWKIPFFGAAPAELAVVGNGQSNLDVTVADASGSVVCLDRSASDRILCAFTPAENGYFQITVQNLGQRPNGYELLTN